MLMVTDYEDQREIIQVRTHFNAGTTLHLYKNDYTPNPDSAAGNFTEANFPGYASEALDGTWAAEVEDDNGKWSIKADAVTFTRSGAGADNTVYGIWVDDGAGVVFAERFGTPIVVDADALPFRIQVQFTIKSEAVL